MRIIIAGSRNFTDYELFKKSVSNIINNLYLDGYIEKLENSFDLEIISGGARGADSLAIRYAKEKNILLRIMNADWDEFGKSAGYRRNVEMAEYASKDNGRLIAFNKGTKGTQHMIDISKKYNLEIYEIKV